MHASGKVFFVYILASRKHGTVYIGVTSDLLKRVSEHRAGIRSGFATKHKVHRLVYYEAFADAAAAIQREKAMKKWKREWKINLIERSNPDWSDLFVG